MAFLTANSRSYPDPLPHPYLTAGPILRVGLYPRFGNHHDQVGAIPITHVRDRHWAGRNTTFNNQELISISDMGGFLTGTSKIRYLLGQSMKKGLYRMTRYRPHTDAKSVALSSVIARPPNVAPPISDAQSLVSTSITIPATVALRATGPPKQRSP